MHDFPVKIHGPSPLKHKCIYAH